MPEFRDEALPDGLLGECDVAAGLIVIDPDQTAAQYRSTLEHEWEHWLRGDVPSGDWARDARIEKATDEAAARRLIPLDALMDALRYCHCLAEVAEELGVDADLLSARLRTLEPEDRATINGRCNHENRSIA